MKNVLVVVAHADDGSLGAGGAIAKHVMAGDNVSVLVLCGNGMRSAEQLHAGEKAMVALGVCGLHRGCFPDQKFETVSFLEITQFVEKNVDIFKPEIIYTHHAGDLNMDHRITHQAVLTACRPLPGCSVKEIYGMEVLSSTEWGEPFNPTHFVEITGAPYEAKMSALDCYADEMRPAPHARSFLRVHALSVYRGGQVGVRTAEAFTTIRRIA